MSHELNGIGTKLYSLSLSDPIELTFKHDISVSLYLVSK